MIPHTLSGTLVGRLSYSHTHSLSGMRTDKHLDRRFHTQFDMIPHTLSCMIVDRLSYSLLVHSLSGMIPHNLSCMIVDRLSYSLLVHSLSGMIPHTLSCMIVDSLIDSLVRRLSYSHTHSSSGMRTDKHLDRRFHR